jgi:isopenicillin N synthase-like dioxygenase
MQVAPIDLRPFREGSSADRVRVGAKVDAAGRTSGFLAVTGHGIDPALMREMLDVTRAFFDLGVEEKMALWVENRAANRGYAPVGSEALAYSLGETDLPPDLFEAFNIGREIAPQHERDPYVADVRSTFFAPNVWPTRPGRFREVWLEYWEAVEELVAVALALPDGFFRRSIDRSISVMRANHYERRPGAPSPLPDQMRMGAHTDYGSITVLLADEVPGLQIRDDAGGWSDVVPPRDGFLVNIGDLLAQWTNDRWRSTLHRVVPPPHDGDGSARRTSIAWFQQPNWNTLISCLPTCCADTNPPRYKPVRSGDHLMAKLMGPRLLRSSDASPAVGQ